MPSHFYSYSFALNPEWSHRFSPGTEIRGYFEWVAQEHNVLPHVRFGDEVIDHYVRAAEWEQEEYDRRITDWEVARGFERA